VLAVGRRIMSEDKRKVKTKFNREAIRDSIERMKPERLTKPRLRKPMFG
jgi:hypothetical protein